MRPWEIDDCTYGELEEMTSRLRKLPPIGGVLMMEPKKR